MSERIITIKPGEVWLPSGVCPVARRENEEAKIQGMADSEAWWIDTNSQVSSDTLPKPEHCYHIWQEITLFTSTVTECRKCGKLKE